MESSNKDLSAIQSQLDTIKWSTPLSEVISYHDIHHDTAIYGIVIVAGIIGAVLAYRRVRWRAQEETAASAEVGAQLLEFLRQFLQMFPELRQAPLFIAGESYAGKYIPALGIQIHKKKTEGINMKGILIGNGLIDPRSTMHYSKLCEVLGILEDSKLEVVKNMEENVVKLIDQHRIVDASNEFNATIEYIKKHSGISVYNFNSDPDNEAPEFESYITKPEVRRMIHAGNVSFDLNNQVVYTKMLPDIMNTTKPWVEELLEHYGVMIYYGQLDVILGYGGARPLLRALRWSAAEQFAHAPRRKLYLTANGAVVGYKRSGGNLTEVIIRRAGHMVLKDQPEVAKFILDTFIGHIL